MQLYYYFLMLSIVALACANPLPNTSTTLAGRCSATISAKYDDLPMQLPVAAPLPFGPYLGLNYTNLAVVTLGVLGTPPPTGVMTASNPNVIAITALALVSKATASVIGGGAGYKSFNPQYINYGCVLRTQEAITGVPASCTIAFSGYKAGVRVVRQFVTYEVANGELTKDMSTARLQGFDGVDTFQFELIVPNYVVVGVLLDDFKYVGCY